MKDLIDRQTAIDALTRTMVSIPTAAGKDLMADVNNIRAEDIAIIKRLPSVQSDRKRGKWIYNSPVTMKCDQCGYVIKDWRWNELNFCANCGADMRGEQE